MLSHIGISALVVLSGLSLVAADDLATISPCPSCPSSLSMAPITVTEQYQAVSTCVPEETCSKTKCSSTASCSTYDFVSTYVPANGGATTTLITKTDQELTLVHVSTVLTTYLPCPTASPIWNGGLKYRNETAYPTACTSTQYQTMEVDISAPYNLCGPLALPPWEGSELCGDDCGTDPDEEKDQQVQVRKCLDGVCSTYAETWVSVKPTTASSSSTVPYSTSAYCTQSGYNTVSVTATVTPSAGADFIDPATHIFSLTTSVPSPGPIQITKTITVTFTKSPEPTVAYSTSVAAFSTKTYCSNGVHTIPITTTCNPSDPYFTEPVTTTVYYTTTVTDGPKTVDCTQTATVTFTSTTTVCPQTVISGQTQYPTTAPQSVSAPTTYGYPTSYPASSYPASSFSSASSTTSPSTTGTDTTSTSSPSTTDTSTTSTSSSTTLTSTSSTSTSTTSTISSTTSEPTSQVTGWDFVGCLGSSDGFSSFTLLESSSENDIEFCNTECQAAGFVYSGVYSTDCYCANTLEATTDAESVGQCNLPCPGNPLEFCGGTTLVSRKRQTTVVILINVFVFVGTPTVTSSSTTSEATPDPSSDPDPAPARRGIDADMELASRARDVRVRRGGLLRNPNHVQQGVPLAKRDYGLKQLFGL